MLLDQTDFLVVGALGPQGAGKSTIMSALAGVRTLSDPRYGQLCNFCRLSGSGWSYNFGLYLCLQVIPFPATDKTLSGEYYYSYLVTGLNNWLTIISNLSLPQYVQYSAVQCSAVQCSAVQCSAVQCSAVQCSAVQCSAVQCSTVTGRGAIFLFPNFKKATGQKD